MKRRSFLILAGGSVFRIAEAESGFPDRTIVIVDPATAGSSTAVSAAKRLRGLDSGYGTLSGAARLGDSQMQWKSYLVVLAGVVLLLVISRSVRQHRLWGSLKNRARIATRNRAPLP